MVAINTSWRPKVSHSSLPWKLTKIFIAEDGETVYRLEKYQGGRNSPALLTKKKLLQNFKHDEQIKTNFLSPPVKTNSEARLLRTQSSGLLSGSCAKNRRREQTIP